MKNSVIAGGGIKSRDRIPGRLSAGRLCLETNCSTRISIYNRAGTGLRHGALRFPPTRGRVKTGLSGSLQQQHTRSGSEVDRH